MREVTPEKQAEYNRTYYETHKEDIRKARKDRYQTDPEYRRKVRLAALERKRRVVAERKKKNIGKPARRGPTKPTMFTITVSGSDRRVKMYSAGQLASRLNRKTQTLRVWESKGILPPALYRSGANDRLYTEFQVRELSRAYFEAAKESGQLVKSRISSTSFPEAAKKLWREYPLGVDPAE